MNYENTQEGHLFRYKQQRPKGVRKYMIKKFQTPKGKLHLYKQQNPKVRVNL